ncbi:hypothetical protein CAOG_010146 [Capsaspora owczarzaki ATCC 30864]|uniref:Fibronectin type-III domain-containing protein n=1 Tax=Capsaspora owczarzaki (strain ATCC 30864) TaxID=595528 RepID=A0A0D2URR4_CAPO3|nr:hypothetical protein CAOG_010146 [Capsaspora owczarzaki ATCC 30864]
MNFWVFCPAFDPPTGGFITQQTCNNGKTAIAPPSLWTVAQAQDNEEDRWYCQSNLLKPGAANCPGNNPPRSCTNRNSITYGWLYQAISLSSFAKNSGYIDGTRVVVSFTAAFTNSNQHGGYLFLRIYNAANTVLGERWSNTLTTAGALTISTPLPAGSVSMNAYLSGFRNAGGSGPINAFFGSVYMTLAAAPMKQAGVFATAASYRSVDLSWSLVQNTQQSVSSFTVQYSTTANFASFQNVTGLSSSSTSYTVAGLTRNTLYYFRIYAVNSIGTSDPSDTKQATTLNLSFAGTGWGACSGCGGTQQMQYQCTDTVTNYADGTCTTNGVTKPTNTQPCNVIMSYAPVSPCSAACGATQTVTATAVLSNAVSPTACLQTQLQSCTGAPCPTNCAYASWPSFDPCSNCATLSITRTIATSAAFGGSACLDPSVSTSACSCTISATPEVSISDISSIPSSATPEVSLYDTSSISSYDTSSISSSATSSVTPYVATSTPGASVPAPTTSTVARSSATSSISKSATPSASRLSSSRTATLASTTGGAGSVENQTDSGGGFPLGAIIGAIAGIVLLVVIILFVIARRRKARESKSGRGVTSAGSQMELVPSSRNTATAPEPLYAGVSSVETQGIYSSPADAATYAVADKKRATYSSPVPDDNVYVATQDAANYASTSSGYSDPAKADLYDHVNPAPVSADNDNETYATVDKSARAPGAASSKAFVPSTIGPNGDVYAVASSNLGKEDESLYDSLGSPASGYADPRASVSASRSLVGPRGDVYALPTKESGR